MATRKVHDLRAAGASVTVVSPSLTADLVALVDAGELTHRERRYRASDLGVGSGSDAARPWWLVVAATDDPAVNREVAADGEASVTWVNVVSEPDGGPVARPAVHRAGHLTLTVATDGVHPAAAVWLRDVAAAAIGPEHLTLLDLLAELRRGRPGSRVSWQAVTDSGTLDLIREGHVAQAKERLEACLSSSSD